MVTISKIIDGLEMVDDMTDCYYNPEKDEIFLSNIGEYEDLTEDEIDELFEASIILPTQHEINEYQIMVDFIETIDNPTFKTIIEDILLGVEAGENMYTTMEYYSSIFPPIYINMIKVGELSGSLTNALQQAVKYLEDTEAMNKKLKEILIPNLVQFVLLLVLAIVGTLISVPMIQNVFDSFGSKEKLPPLTIAFSNFLNYISKIFTKYLIYVLVIVI